MFEKVIKQLTKTEKELVIGISSQWLNAKWTLTKITGTPLIITGSVYRKSIT